MGPRPYFLCASVRVIETIKETSRLTNNFSRSPAALFLVPDMWPTSLSEAVSTSNHLVQQQVTIETDETVVWTMEVRGGGD